ncbi:hypothetical protein [Amorphus sp. 3PC139-8]|uniref:hypothetical protein n=1 Tax=Amorphus sp. 3PC139-8 TaxID=2735676 RepID=UPI00345DC082
MVILLRAHRVQRGLSHFSIPNDHTHPRMAQFIFFRNTLTFVNLPKKLSEKYIFVQIQAARDHNSRSKFSLIAKQPTMRPIVPSQNLSILKSTAPHSMAA